MMWTGNSFARHGRCVISSPVYARLVARGLAASCGGINKVLSFEYFSPSAHCRLASVAHLIRYLVCCTRDSRVAGTGCLMLGVPLHGLSVATDSSQICLKFSG